MRPTLSMLLLFTAGCAAVVVPPSSVRDPVTVFVLREAMHVGLVLPDAGGYVEFGFGDYDWYALGQDRINDVAATVLWPTAGTLARRSWRAGDEATLLAMAWYCELRPVVVERVEAQRLAAQLQAQFAAGGRPLGHAGSEQLCQPCAADYWLFWNCYDAAAEWLRQLGCRVGRPLLCTGIDVRSG